MTYWPNPDECMFEVRDLRLEGRLPGCQHYDPEVDIDSCRKGEWCKNGGCVYPNKEKLIQDNPNPLELVLIKCRN